ncbi:MAG: acyl-CoA dehydrogenase family protein, partial [Actinobacteria bacterium]|nr:acyl-CoA dehydrogenase family protein [Actinomycetota bacterium]
MRPDPSQKPSAHADLFNADHEALRTQVRAFVEKELLSHAQEWERVESFPRDIFKRVG